MKRAFTLVEMAMVIVIIGIIMGIAIGSVSLITTAKIRSDLAKIKKFKTATLLYYNTNGRAPDDNASSSCKFDFMQAYAPYVNESDYFMASAGENAYFGIFRAEYDNNSYIPDSCKPIYNTSMLNPFVAITGGVVEKSSGQLVHDTTHFSRVLACNIEKTLDDRSLNSGYGRAVGNNIAEVENIKKTDYDDCGSFAADVKNGYDANSTNEALKYAYILININ